MPHTTCAGIDTCSDPGDPPLVRCTAYTKDGNRYCARHAVQANRQDALRDVLKPGWWKKLRFQPARRSRPESYADSEIRPPKVEEKPRSPLASVVPTAAEARKLLRGGT